jgi:type IV secretory pathway TrbD component
MQGIFVFLLWLLGDFKGQLKAKADREAEERLPSLTEYLWRLDMDKTGADPHKWAVSSASELESLLSRVRRCARPITRHRALQKNTSFGYVTCTVAVVVALACGAAYLVMQPLWEWISLVSISLFAITTILALWYLGKVCFYHYILARACDEE